MLTGVCTRIWSAILPRNSLSTDYWSQTLWQSLLENEAITKGKNNQLQAREHEVWRWGEGKRTIKPIKCEIHMDNKAGLCHLLTCTKILQVIAITAAPVTLYITALSKQSNQLIHFPLFSYLIQGSLWNSPLGAGFSCPRKLTKILWKSHRSLRGGGILTNLIKVIQKKKSQHSQPISELWFNKQEEYTLRKTKLNCHSVQSKSPTEISGTM